MVQLSILSGKQAGSHTVARHFPFSVGRGGDNGLQLDDDGVWDRHVTIEFDRPERFVVRTAGAALVALNQQPVQSAPLRNGDVLSIGSVKLRFSLAAAAQRGLMLREFLIWGLLGAVTAAQIALIYWLAR